jgi:hypothetical protein
LKHAVADEVLLARLMEEQGALAGTSEGGVDWPALTEGDRIARDLLRAKFDAFGMRMIEHGTGDVFGCLDLEVARRRGS